jgi:hypothetical protein
VDEARKQVDERTRDHPVDLPGFGDAAFWIGTPNYASLFVFRGGTMRLMIGPSEIGVEKEKELAIKALGGTGQTTTARIYGAPRTLAKPVLSPLGPKPSQIDQLEDDVTTRVDRGDVKAQLRLGKLYQSAPWLRMGVRSRTMQAQRIGINRHRIAATRKRRSNWR